MLVSQFAFCGLLEIPDIKDTTSLRGKSVFENMDIPAVPQRDPNPDAGPRIWVLKIKVQGVVERPEFGITQKGVDEFVEKLRYEFMREDELLKFGFSLEDLAEIANLMLEIDAVNRLEQVTEPDLQRLVWLVRQQKERRGLTLGDIEEIGNKLTNYYRERGFILSKAYVPSQQVRDGVVGITVLEGKLGKLSVTGNEQYKTEFISKPFDELMYQPVNANVVEQKLYLLNDFPGLDVYGYFNAGDQVGDTHLTLQVRKETPWTTTLRADNYGSELTGRTRFYAQVQWHNPIKIADDVTIGVLQSVDPDNATYGVFRYRAPIFSEAYHLGINYSRNQFAIGAGRDSQQGNSILDLTGNTSITEAVFDYSILRSRENNWQIGFHLANKESDVTSVLAPLTDDTVFTYKLSSHYDVLDTKSRSLHDLSTSLVTGKIKKGADAEDVDFNKLNLEYSYLTFAKVPFIKRDTRFIVKSLAQYSEDVLKAVEQFSLTGANVVRAFSVTEFPSDKGIYVGLDWVFPFPEFADFGVYKGIKFSRVASPFLFLDYAYGELKGFGEQPDTVGKFAGYGIGLQFNYQNQFSGNFQIAKSLQAYISDDNLPDPDEGTYFVADFQYVFD